MLLPWKLRKSLESVSLGLGLVDTREPRHELCEDSLGERSLLNQDRDDAGHDSDRQRHGAAEQGRPGVNTAASTQRMPAVESTPSTIGSVRGLHRSL